MSANKKAYPMGMLYELEEYSITDFLPSDYSTAFLKQE
jgi:hypothetical protein